MEIALLALQTLVVLFLWLHDWVPMRRLNDINSVRAQDSREHRLLVTALPGVPALAGLTGSFHHYGGVYPHWLNMLLGITYSVILLGVLRAWWIPYLLIPDEQRAARYRVRFARTHTFLPQRHGVAPDTLHTLFHVALAAILLMLLIRTLET